MDSTFATYFKLGRLHITDIQAYDHMLFLVALCAIFSIGRWKPLLILITGFTLGHSLTLALAGLDVVRFPVKIVETLIPITIILTALYNLRRGPVEVGEKISWGHYGLATFFGLIHGMGFSFLLRAMMMPGAEGEFVWQLLAFNLGIEVGQIMIVAGILLLSYLFINQFKLSKRLWNKILSGAAILISLFLLLELHFLS